MPIWRRLRLVGSQLWGLLRLDTTPPQIIWGAYTGAEAGGTFEIAYVLDEPGVIEATITIDGDEYPLTVGGGVLTATLPNDIEDGMEAIVTVLLRDDVGNETTASFIFTIGEVEPPPVVIPRAARRRKPIKLEVELDGRVNATRKLEPIYIEGRVAAAKAIAVDIAGRAAARSPVAYELAGLVRATRRPRQPVELEVDLAFIEAKAQRQREDEELIVLLTL